MIEQYRFRKTRALAVSRRQMLIASAVVGLTGCSRNLVSGASVAKPNVTYEPFDPAFEAIVDQSDSGRLLGAGYKWSEGPAWDAQRQCLYFSDVPANRAYRWSEEEGIEIFQDPSGIPPELKPEGGDLGTNGLLIGNSGELLICNHGKRVVEAMNLETGERRVLTSNFEGARYNSPNDLIETSDGTIYFTDPPYGLEGQNDSPAKQMEANGVYRLGPAGEVTRILDDMTFPNGVVLSPDESTLFVAQSDPSAPLIRTYDLAGDKGAQLWFDAAPYMDGHAGLPDGMAVSRSGHIFLAGPGGVLVIDPSAKCLGRIASGRATANCAFGEDGRTLFITAQDRLLAVRTKVDGLGRY
jgi:gluconolactonase